MSSIEKKIQKNLQGKEYWRSLEELAETPEFKEFLQREFPEGASELSDAMSRRQFLTLMGASMALAGLMGCRRPVEKIVPYVKAPENVIPGVPKYYATTMPLGLNATGLLVESHEGRPTKIEGNEKHPASLGAAGVFQQASILNLYDPDRSKFVLRQGAQAQWADFVAYWQEQFNQFSQNRGEGLVVLSEAFSSPTLARLRTEFLRRFPRARWVAYEPVSDENIIEGVRVATGRAQLPVYRLDQAEVILSLDSDFLTMEGDSLVNARGFADGRRVQDVNDSMNRLYVVESTYTATGAAADHRMRLQARQIGAFTAALALALEKQGLRIRVADELSQYANHSFDQKWINAVAKDLLRARGRSLVLAGRRQPASVHALVFAINNALGNVGKTVAYVEPVDKLLPNTQDLSAVVEDMKAGRVKTLVMFGGNPVYNAPADLAFGAALKRVEQTIHFSTHVDETSSQVEWHVPQAHFLESWGDARALDGTMSVIQPLIQPLFGAKSDVEFAALLATGQDVRGYDVVRETWKAALGNRNFERKWRRVLHDGIAENTQLTARAPRERSNEIARYLNANPFARDAADKDKLEIVFVASSAVFDGRYANNGWLQELPDPTTKLTWDNALLVSPKTAKELNLASNELVLAEVEGRRMKLPVFVMPGQPDYSVAVALGYGRTHAGRVGNGVGFNTYRLRSSGSPDFALGVNLVRTGERYVLASTQDHWSMEGRPIVRDADLDYYRQHPEFAREMVEHPPLTSLWKEHTYDTGYQWGMTVDLNVCIGCNACVTACQSENNIPIVGKEQVWRGREMHWMRIDRYFQGGELDSPAMVYQPMMCQHCEMAPCEQVCPVAATVHDEEGLNVMVYNRCIGTRYCSNNCPYKVRRFNFFNYTNETPEIVKMAMNPDVTVRFRGVMEKCTFCLQRINEVKIRAKNEGREVRDGEIRTACQQTCPTNAIVFGNINDPESEVSKIKQQNRNYEVLSELNTRPRTSYLAKLRNPNPELVAES